METILSAAERTERAKLAANTRWAKKFDWETSPLTDCEDKLADLRAEAEKGGLIMQRRMSIERVNDAICYNPDCKGGGKDNDGNNVRAKIDIGSGRFAGSRTRTNPQTGTMETAYACSAVCFLYLSNNFKHSPGAIREPLPSQVMPESVINESTNKPI